MPVSPLCQRRRLAVTAEGIALATLVTSALVALRISWRRWPDPIIDAGHQLYAAWRLSEGAVLYRDVGYLYGPLSAYLNALLFHIFGPGMMVLVWANLCVYAAILAVAYHLLRIAYGVLAAFVSCFVLVWIFSFNQLVLVGNYNYALPYAHESTHGVLVTFVLLAAASSWLVQRRTWQLLAMGLCAGLSLVLKPEFVLASVLVLLATLWFSFRQGRPPRRTEVAILVPASLAPMTGFWLCLWPSLGCWAAFRAANQAWWAVLTSSGRAQVWSTFSGTDAVLPNLGALVLAGLGCVAGVAIMWLGARTMARGRALAGLLLPLPAAWAVFFGNFMQLGWCLPLPVATLTVLRAAAITKRGCASQDCRTQALGLLLPVAALALLLRMFLQPTIYHFGFYQAALAAMVTVAELVRFFQQTTAEHRPARFVALACILGLIAMACIAVQFRSGRIMASRTFAVGTGRDRFLTPAPDRDPSGALVGSVASLLAQRPADERVLVVPEGLMINYLARRKSPVPEWIFIDLTLGEGREDRLVRTLTRDAPEHVVLISRDLREHGITRFGAVGQPGSQLLDFLKRRYRLAGSMGGDPLDPEQRGAVLLELPR